MNLQFNRLSKFKCRTSNLKLGHFELSIFMAGIPNLSSFEVLDNLTFVDSIEINSL